MPAAAALPAITARPARCRSSAAAPNMARSSTYWSHPGAQSGFNASQDAHTNGRAYTDGAWGTHDDARVQSMLSPAQESRLLQNLQWLNSSSPIDAGVSKRIEAAIARVKSMTCTKRILEGLRTTLGRNRWMASMMGAALGVLVTLAGLSAVAVAVPIGIGSVVAVGYLAWSAYTVTRDAVVFVDREVLASLAGMPREPLTEGAPASSRLLWDALFARSNIVTVYDPIHNFATIHLLVHERTSSCSGRYELRLMAIVETLFSGVELTMLQSSMRTRVGQFVFKQTAPGGKFHTKVAHSQGEGLRQPYPILTNHPDHNPTLKNRLARALLGGVPALAPELWPTELHLGRASPEYQPATDLIDILKHLGQEVGSAQAEHLSFRGGCWALPHNLGVIKNQGIPVYLDSVSHLGPPSLIADSVVSMLGIAAANEFSYGRLQFKMTYQHVGEEVLRFGHINVATGPLMHDPRMMKADGHDHIRLFARTGILTTNEVAWGAGGGAVPSSEGRASARRLLSGARRHCAEAMKKVSSLGSHHRDGVLDAETLQFEMALIMWVLKDSHDCLITEFCKAADMRTEEMCRVAAHVVLGSHRDALRAKQQEAKLHFPGVPSKALTGILIEGNATRFLAVAAGILFVCKPVVSSDGTHDTYNAESPVVLNPVLYFDKVLQSSSFYKNDIIFRNYFADTDVSGPLAAVPTTEPRALAEVELTWEAYTKHAALCADVEPNLC